MNTNTIDLDTIRELRETEPKTIEILKAAMLMTDKQLDLLIDIMNLCDGRPDRWEYTKTYTGRMKDLPAALAQI